MKKDKPDIRAIRRMRQTPSGVGVDSISPMSRNPSKVVQLLKSRFANLILDVGMRNVVNRKCPCFETACRHSPLS
jgi:hypothetical protein